jgi:hypothetical protein
VIRPTDEQILDSFDTPEGYVGVLDAPARSELEDRATYDVNDTAAAFRRHFADLTPGDLLLAGVAAVTNHEIDQVALLSVVLFDHGTCLTPFELPDGSTAASLHAHLTRWRHSPGIGFVRTETVTSGRLTRGRTPLHL